MICFLSFLLLKKVEKTGGVSTFSPKVGLKFDGVFKEEALLLKKQLASQLGCTVSDKDEETIIELKKNGGSYYLSISR